MIRGAYLKKMELRFEDLCDDIDRILTKATSSDNVKEETLTGQMRILRVGEERVRERLRAVRESDPAEWGTHKADAEESLEDLQRAVHEAMSLLKKTG
jgi:hypothetical protein